MLYAAAICLFARVFGFLTWGGSVAAFGVGAAVWEAGGIQLSSSLLLFFISSTALGKLLKNPSGQVLGPRNAVQVLANGGPSAVWALAYIWRPGSEFLVASIAGFAAANADTWATEIGSRFGRNFFRITTIEKSERGRSGVVSGIGLFAAFCGACAIASTAPLLQLTQFIGTLSLCGFAGSILDSLIGDLFQAKYKSESGQTTEEKSGEKISGLSWVNNDAVNFISIAIASIAAYFFAAA